MMLHSRLRLVWAALAVLTLVQWSTVALSAATEKPKPGDTTGLPMYLQIALAFVLVLLSALFAGLTIGIMGLDTLSLEIIANAGSEPDRSYAKTLLPVRKLGHQALCTLVLGNMWANVMIAEFCADIVPEDGGSGGLIGFVLSTLVILIFAEILPMTICKSSNALQVAAGGVPILKIFLILLYPIAKPLGMLLDHLIHHDVGQIYNREELKQLIIVHCETHGDRSGLQKSELAMLLGAMEFHDAQVGDVMTPINEVFMLSEGDVLTDQLLAEIWQKGFSRIPVYRGASKQLITGILYSKDLVLVSSEKIPPTVANFLKKTQRRSVCSVNAKLKLPAMMVQLQSGRAHLYLVRSGIAGGAGVDNRSVVSPPAIENPSSPAPSLGNIVGIITFEDIVEKLIRDEILDEDDGLRIPRVSITSFEVGRRLSPEQMWCCARYLRDAVESFAHWPLEHIKTCIERSGLVIDLYPSSAFAMNPSADEYSSPNTLRHIDTSIFDQSAQPNQRRDSLSCVATAGAIGTPIKDETMIYSCGVPTDVFTLILCGTVDVIAGGAEQFRSQFRRFSWLGERALHSRTYTPTFSAVVRTPTQVLQLRTDSYDLASALIEKADSQNVSLPTKPHGHAV